MFSLTWNLKNKIRTRRKKKNKAELKIQRKTSWFPEGREVAGWVK